MIAGSTVIEPRTATPVTAIAPMANEVKDLSLMKNMPAIETMTVMPLKSTARPDVPSAIASAVSGLWPFWRSER